MKQIKEHLLRQAETCTLFAEQNEKSAVKYSEAAADQIQKAGEHRRLAAEYTRLAVEQPE
ncbi:hypothetical protein [Bradyrhizobium sp. BWC-3-1]|uniref:hypothetical protein n=1 Tax=Bradyrhizobium sp. BWC-3-1 TaxID=3080012 RepID=UPI00293F79DA|nr:hypothetical protein [Bradyrhizobium sp. BWC-3-1]WOH61947.1 hypothetical protein RX329_18370 [Bradyrhizobium sp. BWC-3-1]